MKRLLIGLSALMVLAALPLCAEAQQRRGRGGAGQGSGFGRGTQGAGLQSRSGSPGSGFSQSSNRGRQATQLDGDIANSIDLVRLWEEEKLARDVYAKLASTSNQRVFQNISRSENQHMQAVARLMGGSGTTRNRSSQTPGVFVTPEYQQLYQTLVNEGSRSPLDALKVGAKIEEMDIADLKRLMSSSANPQSHQVLMQLMNGSRNHLRAFASQIANQGGDYQAQFLTQEEFDAIARSGGNGRGGGSGQGDGGKGRGRAGRGPGQGSGNASGGGRRGSGGGPRR
ncbi:DUF2202 domain-containing protein [Rhodopirellula sp. JC639]|uniref:DUF2202 domain-containing protein n=1 Tax=Stieleria mannarensis TaxID=2755585 RepID=UPI001601EC55|nr:DUF2202 domain-containing protein [Rhodopirellula sp. JC639]